MAIKKRIYLTLIAVSFLVLLMIAFIILPLFYRIKDGSKELISQKEKFTKLEIKVMNLEKFKILHADLQRFLKEIDNLFVDSEVPIEFINFLEDTSEKCQLEIEILSVSEKKMEKDFWSHLTFQIVSTGSFPDFLKFLEKIENGPYLVELQNININELTEDKEAESGKIKAMFSVKVFAK